MERHNPQLRFSRKQLLLAVIGAIGLYIIVPQIGSFKASLHQLQHPDPLWVVAAVACAAGTYIAAALTYWFLAFRPLQYLQVLLVQFAAMFVNRLLPGGVGAIGTNYAYLHHKQHTAAQAATVVAINNFWGFVGNMLLLVAIIVVTRGNGLNQSISRDFHVDGLLVGGAVLLMIVVVGLIFGGQRFRSALKQLGTQLASYRRRPLVLVQALLSSMLLTLCNVLCLYSCMLALGIHLPLAPVVVIITLGVGAGTATPTPGGLGGFEAGLVAGFAAYRVPVSTALAIALLYRLISYWLTLLVGALAFVVTQRRKTFG